MRKVAGDPGQTWLTTHPTLRGIQQGGGILHPQLEGVGNAGSFIAERSRVGVVLVSEFNRSKLRLALCSMRLAKVDTVC
jgi:hypothetical protein